MHPLLIRWLGSQSYTRALAVQEQTVVARRRGDGTDTLILLEHTPVVTLGRGSHAENLLTDADELARLGVDLHESGRGGDVTYHGPGQLVGYPILALGAERRDAHRYLRDLEEVLIRTVGRYGIDGGRTEGMTGVWVGERKIAAIGVRLSSGWITSHGFALNVADDLEGFEHIVPCGIRGRGVTSLERESGRRPELREVAGIVARELAEVFGLDPRSAGPAEERLEMPAAG